MYLLLRQLRTKGKETHVKGKEDITKEENHLFVALGIVTSAVHVASFPGCRESLGTRLMCMQTP